MNNSLKTTLIVIGIIIGAAVLLFAGVSLGRAGWGMAGYGPGTMMSGNVPAENGMMQSDMMNAGGMMGTGNMMDQGNMMGGGITGNGMMSGGSMMGANSGLYPNPNPLSLDQAQQAVDNFLTAQGNTDLALGEIMIFDNHAYAQIVEQSTGIGAMEVLVDPVTLAVSPEHGPNMMWNLKYGMTAGYGGGMMGTMMGGGSGMMDNVLDQPATISADMPITLEEAVESAQRYLDAYLPGTQVADHADPFYGYYTLHILRDGEVIGMLSVNGYTRQVFPHTWHGEFLEMNGE